MMMLGFCKSHSHAIAERQPCSRGGSGGHVLSRAIFLQVIYKDMNFIYEITDLTPTRLICPPEIVKVGSTPDEWSHA